MTLPELPAAHARILALGHYQPANVITNDDLVARGVDTDDEWIRTRVGIAERRYADPDETVLDIAERAARDTLDHADAAARDIDLVVVATCSTRSQVPAVAPQLAARLGIASPGAFDVSGGCSGFVYALNAVAGAVRSGQASTVLLVGAERFSGWLDWTDRSTCILLGDGAGGALIGRSPRPALGPVVWGSNGALADTVTIDEDSHFFTQQGQAVYRWATTEMAPVAAEACRRAGVAPSELAAFIPHQANLRIIDMIARKLGIASEKVARDIGVSGNTAAASVPLAMSKMMRRGEIPSGAPVLLLGFGSGLAYAAQVVLAP
ncbi:MAG: ketoacyl-ACP synthase III [Actinomycetia bacterium]|nr:ketoacyl-ACP synthase III [Actinomycetes bacterium]